MREFFCFTTIRFTTQEPMPMANRKTHSLVVVTKYEKRMNKRFFFCWLACLATGITHSTHSYE